MGKLKRLGLQVLEDIHVNGPATRKQLWERNQGCSWEMFKRLIGKLTIDGVVRRDLANPPVTDPSVDEWVLTSEGHKIVQEILC